MEFMQIVWIALIVVFIVVEGITIGLTSIWFAAGSAVALILSFFGAHTWLQMTAFFVVSIFALLLTRPLAKKYVNSKVQPTNADMIIGNLATVTQRIDNVAGTGMAKVGGRMWTARSATGQVIEEGALAQVAAIEGVKIILIPQSSRVEQVRAQ